MSASRSDFQREEIEASVRSGTNEATVDSRGVAMATEAAARIVEQFGSDVVSWSNWRDEITLHVQRTSLLAVSCFLKDELGFALLSDISPCDYLNSENERPARFSVSYHVTKMVDGAPRLRLQVWLDEGETVQSLIDVWPTADWHEREAFDFFGIEFTGRKGLRRLIMPDDWVGNPLRKDYPLGGEPVTFTNTPREL